MINIPTFKEFLNESIQTDKVYIQQNTLWCSYSPGSGVTTQIKGDPEKFRGFFTNKKGDDHYDSIVDKILEWSKKEKADIKKGGTSLFKIPCYWGYKSARDLSIWAGDLDPDYQPDYFLWMLVQTMGSGDTIINFFKTKREALSFWSK